MKSKKRTHLLDHRFGAGRIDPRRLGAVLSGWAPRRRGGEGRLLRFLATALLALNLAAVITDQSPVAIFRHALERLEAIGVFVLKVFVAIAV